MKILLFTARLYNYGVFAFSVLLPLCQNTNFFCRGILSVIDALRILCGNTGLRSLCMRSSYNRPGPKSVCSRPAAFFPVLGLVRSCGLAENLDAIWMGLHCSGEGWESCTTPPGSVFLVFFFLVFNCTVGEPQDVLRIVKMHSLPFPNLLRLLFFFFFPIQRKAMKL